MKYRDIEVILYVVLKEDNRPVAYFPTEHEALIAIRNSTNTYTKLIGTYRRPIIQRRELVVTYDRQPFPKLVFKDCTGSPPIHADLYAEWEE